MVETSRLESGHTLTGIGGSNPSLSAMQSELQRNSATLLLKHAKKAGFSRYFLHRPDQRKLGPEPLRSCCGGFSPEPALVVRFQEFAR